MHDSALFSIKPEFAEKIFSGEKKYEFRRKLSRYPISKMYIYVTTPVCKIVGYTTVLETLSDEPAQLWEVTARYAGLSKEQYNSYFSQCSIAHAYHLYAPSAYSDSITISAIKLVAPPQSFYYLNEEQKLLLLPFEQSIRICTDLNIT